MDVKKKYINIINEYIKLFEEKQGLELILWFGDDIGGVADFGCTNIFSFNVIRYDIDNNIKPGEILNWHNENLESDKYISYKSYCMGHRVSDLKN